MLKDNRSKFLFGVLASIGLVGFLGQAAKLHNSLVHSYPFKMMDTPPADFYSSIGQTGYYFAVFAGILAIIVSIRLPRLLTSALPVIVCPLVYWLVVDAAHLMRGFTRDQMLERNFDGYTGDTARYEFGYEVLVLLVVGAIIGVAVGLVATKLANVRSNNLA
jgi:hypothetical protein